MNKMYRQGDVLVRMIDGLPENATEVTNPTRIVLAYGEVTGHAHTIMADEAQEFSFVDADTRAGGVVRRFLKVFDRGAELRHEEHATLPLPPGIYEIIQQREYAPQSWHYMID